MAEPSDNSSASGTPVPGASTPEVSDGATPHFAAEYVWAHMDLPPEALARFTHHYHEAGHMMYLKPEAPRTQLAALRDFVTA